MEPPRRGATPRDRLEATWPPLLDAAFGRGSWRPIPNVGPAAADLLGLWHLDGVILTGGNDVGSSQARDATEHALVTACLITGRPLLAICRGLQLLQVHFGGILCRAGDAHEGGHLHAVQACEPLGQRILGAASAMIPSFHRFGARVEDLAPALEPWAISPDGLVEGLRHRVAPLVATQWHPERPMPGPDVGRRLLCAWADA